MARRRYYRVRRVYPKQKWLPTINEIPIDGNTVSAGNARIFYNTITQNATRTGDNAQGGISSASIVKVGRFRYRGNILTPKEGFTYIIGLTYIPEGYSLSDYTGYTSANLGTSFFYRHPEWILCWTRIDYINDTQRNEFSMSSRLKRNLNSGDAIVAFVIAINNNTEGVATSSNINGTISYVCRTN